MVPAGIRLLIVQGLCSADRWAQMSFTHRIILFPLCSGFFEARSTPLCCSKPTPSNEHGITTAKLLSTALSRASLAETTLEEASGGHAEEESAARVCVDERGPWLASSGSDNDPLSVGRVGENAGSRFERPQQSIPVRHQQHSADASLDGVLPETSGRVRGRSLGALEDHAESVHVEHDRFGQPSGERNHLGTPGSSALGCRGPLGLSGGWHRPARTSNSS